jgi:excisionase family DNA binding protein
MLTVPQVAALLNAHPHSVRRWADSGLLQCYRIGVRGGRRFRIKDVHVFLESSSRDLG